jgi:tartrate dehydrogenase/decarboxylase/D-malate dehydrogenase
MEKSKPWNIAVTPGDGIGPEVMHATLQLLEKLRDSLGLQITWQEFGWPSTAWHRDHGSTMPEDGLEQLKAFDAVLLGALGDPGPTSDPDRYVLPDGISLAPLLDIRKGFDLWACERPARLYEGAPQYLADPRAKEVDMLVIRENSEGEYVNQGGRLAKGTDHEIATQVEVFTHRGAERLIRHAFERARQRKAQRKATGAARSFKDPRGEMESQVCLITKRNALPHWGELYTEVFAKVGQDYPDIAMHHELVDAACMKFVQAPWQFDVIAASNLHGDILTDLAAVLSGGMGVAPSSNINPDDRSLPPLFEPTHGSAPDIAGQGKADPRAMILTAAEMLAWLGEEDPIALQAANKLRDAVKADLASRPAPNRGTVGITEALLNRLGL